MIHTDYCFFIFCPRKKVQEITGSGNIDEYSYENSPEEVVNVEDINEQELEIIDSEEEEVTCNIQLNATNEKKACSDANFKPPKEKTLKPQNEPSLHLDSDSNYSFSEHFDVAPISENDANMAAEEPIFAASLTAEKLSNYPEIEEERLVTNICRPTARGMESLPDFIPLNESIEHQNEQNDEIDNVNIGISRQFVAAESDDEDMDNNCSPLTEIPCEAKIYLTNFHTKYLLSPPGSQFLLNISRANKLKARLDFTSVGYVLVIFGLISNQAKFQKELLLKYRDLEDEKHQRMALSSVNIPKRNFVLIKFLRSNITQLMSSLGDANRLLKRLQFLERQQTKSALKLAEKTRKSLNMILVGQAGLQDGTMHLNKLLSSLKTLLKDEPDALVPGELRSAIIDHWKVIFSGYRHDNYQQLVETYNTLVSKNRLLELNIDPVLLGQKVLDTNLSEEQKQRLEQPRMEIPQTTELPKQTSSNSMAQKTTKNTKGKQTTETANASKHSATNATQTTNKVKTNNSSSNIKKKPTSTNVSTNSQNTGKTSANAPTPAKPKVSNPKMATIIKTHHQPTNATANEASKKPTQSQAGTPSSATPKKRTTMNTTIGKVADNWKNVYDTLLTEISSEKRTEKNSTRKVQDSQIPSAFWSRESIRYLDDCICLAAARSELVEKLQRVQKKSQTGQLSYNDYLAVIKLHTALKGK